MYEHSVVLSLYCDLCLFYSQEFFLTVKDLIRRLPRDDVAASYNKFSERDRELNRKYMDTQTAVHAALCGEWHSVVYVYC